MNRTHLAAVASAIVVAVSLSGLGVFLGFPATPAVWVGIVCGLLAGLLLLGASRRAETFHPTETNAHLADHSDHLVDPDDPDDPPAGDARG